MVAARGACNGHFPDDRLCQARFGAGCPPPDFWELHAKVTKQLSASPVGQGERFRIEVLDLDGLNDGPREIPAVGQLEHGRSGPGKGRPADRPSNGSGRDAVSGCAPRSRHPVTSSGSIITDRDDQGSGRVVHDESEIALKILPFCLFTVTENSADQHSL